MTTNTVRHTPAAREWQDISTGPKDGTEVLGYREDAGIFLMRFCAPADFMTSSEMDDAALTDDDCEREDWFYADFVSGGRVSNDGLPTHWMPLPPAPQEKGEG